LTSDKARELGKTDPTVDVNETGNKDVQTQLRRTKNNAWEIPGSRHINVSASDRASSVIGGVLSNLNRIPQFVTTTLRVQRTGHTTSGLQFHEGGIVPGPRGQEVAAVLQAGERVMSLSEVDAMANAKPAAMSAAGGTTVTNNISFAGAIISSERDAERWVTAALSRAGEHGRPITVRGRQVA
jgi:hypothetical protein